MALAGRRKSSVLKPFSMLFFIVVMVWVGGIFLTTNPTTRIDRACSPVTFADRILVALVQVIHEPYALGTHEVMLSVEYACKFTVWKTFYEDRETYRSTKQAPVLVQEDAGKDRQEHKNTQTSKESAMVEYRVPGVPLPSYYEGRDK